MLVQEGGGALDHVPRHAFVDLAREFDEAERPVGADGVDGDAVAAHPRSGAEGLEAEGLGLGAADDVPQVDAEFVAEDRHLVDQGDVDVPEVGLQELDRLRLAGATRAYHLVGEPAVEGGRRFGAGRGEAADDLGGAGEAVCTAAGVEAAG